MLCIAQLINWPEVDLVNKKTHTCNLMMDDFYMLIFDVSISIRTLSPNLYQLFPRPLENTIRGPWVALLTRVTIYTSWANHLDIQTCRSNWIFSSLTNVLVNWKKKTQSSPILEWKWKLKILHPRMPLVTVFV